MLRKFAVAKALFLVAFLHKLPALFAACKTECGEDEYCIHETCEKYRCEHITEGESLKYHLQAEIEYCCRHGFILEILCGTTTATAAIATTPTATTTKTVKNSEITTSLDASKKDFPTKTSQSPCRAQAQEPGKYMLTGIIVVKGLSRALEHKFKTVFLSIFVGCPVSTQLKCNFENSQSNIICEYNLQYAIKRDTETQRMLLKENDFVPTLNSELKDQGEQLKVTQHVPPKSILQMEGENSDDLIMIVAIISAVSAGGVLLLVVIAIVAFAMIASRSPEEEEEEEGGGQLEVARVVASTSPGYDRPIHHHRPNYGNNEMRARVNPNTVSLDMNDAYDHNMTETEDDDFDDMVDSMTSERNGSDSNYSC